jgi:hypothetical protein
MKGMLLKAAISELNLTFRDYFEILWFTETKNNNKLFLLVQVISFTGLVLGLHLYERRGPSVGVISQ